MNTTNEKRIYLDNAAATPLHPKVFEKMLPYLKEYYGNPSSIHSYGRKVKTAIEEAREVIASFINAKPGEVYFTSGGTEANNFPIFGIALTEREESGRSKIFTTQAEHLCVIEPFQQLEKNGFTTVYGKINSDSSIDVKFYEESLTSEFSFVSVIHANNETGCINDIKRLARTAHSHNTYFHSDAVQSFGKIKIDVRELNIDALSFCAHKIQGPKGIGSAYIKSGTPVSPIILGGSQERNRRGGTENPAAIIGFAEAVKIAQSEMDDNYSHVSRLCAQFKKGISEIDKEGIKIIEPSAHLPYVVNVIFTSSYYNNDPESLLMSFDLNGIAISNGAACSSGTLKPSRVILNTGLPLQDAQGAVRFSFGPQNTSEEINAALQIIRNISRKFRKF